MALLADKGAAVAVAGVVRRGALHFGAAGAGPSLQGAVRVGALRLAVKLRGVALSPVVRAAALAVAMRLRGVQVEPMKWARGVAIIKPLARLSIGAARRGPGPGSSVGEAVQALPAALAGWPLPSGYIGRKLAALAVARGEVAAVVGNALTVGGRVVIEPSGAGVFVATGGEARAVRALALEAAHVADGVVLAAGPVRDAWLSEQRAAGASYVRKNAKVAGKIADEAKRAAVLADLKFMELRA